MQQRYTAEAQCSRQSSHALRPHGSDQVAKAKEKKAKAKEKAEKTTEKTLATKAKAPKSSAKKPASKAAAKKEEAPKSSAKRKAAPKEAPRKVRITAKICGRTCMSMILQCRQGKQRLILYMAGFTIIVQGAELEPGQAGRMQ